MKKKRLQRSDALWLAAVALLVLLQFWWLPGDPGTPDDTYSSTIEGKRGFFQTLENLSKAGLLPPVRRESDKLIPDTNCTLVMLSPDRYPDKHEQAELSNFVINGGSLVFAPNWYDPDCSIPALSINTAAELFPSEDVVTSPATPATPASPTEVSGEDASSATTPAEVNLTAEAEDSDDGSPAASSSVTEPVASESGSASSTPREKSVRQELDETIRGNPGLQPQQNPIVLEDDAEPDNSSRFTDLRTNSQLVNGAVPWRTRASMNVSRLNSTILVQSSAGTPQAAAWNYGNGMVLVSASSDAFSNSAMLNPAQAELAIRLVEFAHGKTSQYNDSSSRPIVISEFLNATDSYRGTGILMSPALRSGTLQLITIALLAGWFGFHRFGPVQRSTSSKRRSLTESAAAVGNLHFRTNSGGETVEGYVEYLKAELQKLFGRSIRLEDTHAIAARSGLDVETVTQRLANATSLANARYATTHQAASAIRDLADLLNRLHGARATTEQRPR